MAVVKGRQQKHAKPKQAHAQAKPEVGRARPGDWTHPVVTAAERSWDLMAAYDKVPVTLVFNYDTGVGFLEEFEEVQGLKPDLCQMPLVFTNGLRFVRRNVVKRGDGAPSLKAKTMQVKVPERKAEPTVVRPTGRRRPSQLRSFAFGPWWRAPAWADSGGTAGAGRLKPRSTRFRVDLALTTALLSQSGRAHNGGRWFLEPLRREGSSSTRLGGGSRSCPSVCPGMGLRLGNRQVGVRVPRDASEAGPARERRRLWRFHGIPMKWQYEDVEALATGADFAKVEILERFKWRGKEGWSLRASRNDELDHLDAGTVPRTWALDLATP